MTRQYCHIGSRTIAYLDSAPGESGLRALVLLHAFPIGANLWEPQMRNIPEGWRLITPDLRGFGGSTELDAVSALSIADYAADVVDLLEELGVKRAVIGGCSMGGYAALALYQSTPELFDGLVLANTRAGADSPESRANRRGMLALVDREGRIRRGARDDAEAARQDHERIELRRRIVYPPAHQAAIASRDTKRHPSHDASPRLDAAASSSVGADAGDYGCRR